MIVLKILGYIILAIIVIIIIWLIYKLLRLIIVDVIQAPNKFRALVRIFPFLSPNLSRRNKEFWKKVEKDKGYMKRLFIMWANQNKQYDEESFEDFKQRGADEILAQTDMSRFAELLEETQRINSQEDRIIRVLEKTNFSKESENNNIDKKTQQWKDQFLQWLKTNDKLELDPRFEPSLQTQALHDIFGYTTDKSSFAGLQKVVEESGSLQFQFGGGYYETFGEDKVTGEYGDITVKIKSTSEYKFSKSEIIDKLNLSLNNNDEYINFSKYILKYGTKNLLEIRDKLKQEISKNKISIQEVIFYDYDFVVFQFRDNIREEINKIFDISKRFTNTKVYGWVEYDPENSSEVKHSNQHPQSVIDTCFDINNAGNYPRIMIGIGIPGAADTGGMALITKFLKDTNDKKLIRPKFSDLDLNKSLYEDNLLMIEKLDATSHIIDYIDEFLEESDDYQSGDFPCYEDFLDWCRDQDCDRAGDSGPSNETTFGIKFDKFDGAIPEENDLEIDWGNPEDSERFSYAIDTGIDTKEIIKFACRGGMDRPITYNYRIRSLSNTR